MDVQTLFPGIDKQAPIPLYYQLKQQILRHISEGTLQFGDLLPSEAEICEKLKISRPTVRQAMGDLTAEGYLTRQKGKGTFVARPKIQGGFFQKLQSFEEEMRQRGLVPSTRVLRLALIDGDSRSCDALGIPEGDRVILLERLRFANGEPIVWVETYLPYQRFPRLLAVDFERQSLYRELEHTYLVPVERVVREIEAVNATAREAELLEIQKNAALCFVKTIAYDYDGVPVEYSRAHYSGDRNRFSVELRRT